MKRDCELWTDNTREEKMQRRFNRDIQVDD